MSDHFWAATVDKLVVLGNFPPDQLVPPLHTVNDCPAQAALRNLPKSAYTDCR